MNIGDPIETLEKELAELKRQRRIRELQAEIAREKRYEGGYGFPSSPAWPTLS